MLLGAVLAAHMSDAGWQLQIEVTRRLVHLQTHRNGTPVIDPDSARQSGLRRRIEDNNVRYRKNPFLSLWLSGANAVFGAARGQITHEMRRQTNATVAEGTRQVLAFWGISSSRPGSPTRRRRRR